MGEAGLRGSGLHLQIIPVGMANRTGSVLSGKKMCREQGEKGGES
ncbi:hypothetical protein HMPREF9374_1299 [Desmospora sp. 8437]|nr:hypothetical protein HMPREF9374_1299 [Desmospora sp. 8437]